ncbi:hypothetical protein PVK06_033665 [Gossypium arboreum]|uniref:SWIM-type domain-containing protein n=1 Tax=Gossypium arboreum TaxID=29729 RepID=A0ABR0NCE3_GOSAR|nr:hypothetical protein PVK06_033665 [Gossypium arboreum]
MREYVPGTVIELQTRPYYGPDDQLQSGKRIFHRMFWTFDPCVRAFPHCKPFMQVDGTWLYGKYTQILLLAIAQDGNRNVLPIAFAIVDKENMESWEFFLTNLRRYVISNNNICIISDRGKGLIAAIRRSGMPWRSVYCIRHIAANFQRDYKNADWKRQVVRMGKGLLYLFNISFNVLGQCYNLSLLNTYAAYELEPHIFRQRMTRLESNMEGQTNTSFRQWLGTMEPWQWTQSFDEGFRYGQMTTNLVEGINAVLLKTRHLSISSVFSATFYRLATLMPRMGQQQVNQIEAGYVFVEDVRDAIAANRRMARSMTVEVYSRRNETFRVTETIGHRPGIPPRSYGVDLRNRRCDCRRFQTLHYPCAHVVAACAKVSLNVEHFIDEVYTLAHTLRVWENEFPMLPDLSTWEVPPTTFELVPDKGLRRNPKGRP